MKKNIILENKIDGPTEFYHEYAEKCIEEKVTYRSLSFFIRKRFIIRKLSFFKGTLLDMGCCIGVHH